MTSAAHGAPIEIDWVSERHLRVRKVDADGAWVRRGAALGAGIRGVVGITPAYDSVLIELDIGEIDEETVETVRRRLEVGGEVEVNDKSGPVVEIPICYDESFALDIEDVASAHQLTAAEVARRHSQAEYSVRFIGFAPGFAYLEGLPAELATPRLATPRVRVPAGSVGIAGGQTGVYPSETAGGWRLIGRTPLTLFDARRERPALLAPGDRVKFVAIGLEDFMSRARGDHE